MSEVSKLNSNERVLITSIGCKIPLSMKGDLIKIAASKGLNTNQILAMMVEKLVMTDGEITFLEEDKVKELEAEKAAILEHFQKCEEHTKKLEATVLKNREELKKLVVEEADYQKAIKAKEKKEAEAIAKTAALEAKIKALEKELSTAKAGAAKNHESSSESLKTLKNELTQEQRKRQQLEARIKQILDNNNHVLSELGKIHENSVLGIGERTQKVLLTLDTK